MSVPSYHRASDKLTDCYYCGERVWCQVFVADWAEAETGYVDEIVVCDNCIDDRDWI